MYEGSDRVQKQNTWNRVSKNFQKPKITLERSWVRGVNPERFKDFRGARDSFILEQK